MPAYFDKDGNFVGDEDRPSIDDPPYVPGLKEIHHQGALGTYSVRVDCTCAKGRWSPTCPSHGRDEMK